MTQREFWDWYHYVFCVDVKKWCARYRDIDGLYRYVDILEQCRILFNYEGTAYSYANYQAIFEKWMEGDFEPDLLQWVENDKKRHGVWKGRIEQTV